MVERQDIDALLISALYGELTPAEETRLAAHLESHPGDRTALADLTHARGLVRESRLLQIQLDPPPSISALLMKEATRCAPKPEVQEGWFARFVRSFAAHPAMAAAAMLVIVLGVATFVTKRKGDQFAESTAPATSQPVIQAEGGARPDDRQGMAGDSPAAIGFGAPSAETVSGSGSAAVIGGLESGKADSYRVALDDGVAQGKDGADGLADAKVAKKRGEVTVTKPTTVNDDFSTQLAKEQQQGPSGAKKKQQGIELRAPQAAPKDFDDDVRRKGVAPTEKAEAKNELASGESDVSDNRAPAQASPSPVPGGSGTGTAPGAARGGESEVTGAAPPSRRAQDPATATQPTTTVTEKRPAAPRATSSPPPAPPAATTKIEPRRDAPTKPAPAKTVDRNAPARSADRAEDKPADPQLAWARDQHAMLIAQVRAGECKKAAGIAMTISNRAPAYYQQNVETDRSVKACIAYINSERERDAEQRSERARANQKRSVNEPAPAKAAEPSKPAAADTK